MKHGVDTGLLGCTWWFSRLNEAWCAYWIDPIHVVIHDGPYDGVGICFKHERTNNIQQQEGEQYLFCLYVCEFHIHTPYRAS